MFEYTVLYDMTLFAPHWFVYNDLGSESVSILQQYHSVQDSLGAL